MSEWFPATLIESRASRLEDAQRAQPEQADTLVRLSLEVPPDVAQSFVTPGQYHRLRVDGADNLFAIASRPGAARFDYLVRRSAGVAAHLSRLPAGATLEVSKAMGPGFPLESARSHRVVMLATGTGFAPVRSVLEQLVVDRAGWGPVQVLAGARDEGEVPPPEDLHRWGSAGLDVRFTLSRAAPGFEGLTGRVQRHLDLLELADAWVFLCGQRDMVADLTAALQQRGVPAERVALNLPRQAG